MRISEPIEKSGYFWLPGKPDNRLPGVLQITDTGKTIIEVIGFFDESLASLNDTNSKIERIVGVIEDGDLVTLDHCFYTNKNINFSGISKSTIYAHICLRGAQYENGEAIAFSRFNFSVEGLDNWLSISGLSIEHNRDDRAASIHFTAPKEISLSLPDGVSLSFTFSWTIPGATAVTEAKITQKAHIALRANSTRPIDEFLKLAFKINNFLCFATDETVSIDSATGFTNKITPGVENQDSQEVPIKIYYESIPHSEAIPKLQWHRMLFRYSHIANQLEKILNNWIHNYDTSEPAFNLYFSSKSGAHKYLNGQFLSLTQGIETLHRRNSQDTLMPEIEFNKLVTEIVNGCPPQKRDWLRTRLVYANELPLRHRMREMLEPFANLYGDTNQRKQLIGKVIDTRNYLTHYDLSLKNQAETGKSLWKLCMKLEALFQLHFLRLIGLNEDSITQLVRENHTLKRKLDT